MKVEKPENLTISGHGGAIVIWDHPVTEVGEYDADAPCVSLGIWRGAGPLLDTFVVWGCDNLEEALEKTVAMCIKEGWTELYTTQKEYHRELQEAMARDSAIDEENFDAYYNYMYVGASMQGAEDVYINTDNLSLSEWASGGEYVAALQRAA